MTLIKVALLFALTACAEIAGCYLPYLWLKQNKSAWLLIPAAISLAMFRMAAFLAPGGGGANLCGLRRRLHLCRAPLALAR